MSSIGSSCSTIISFRGEEEVDLDQALDSVYHDIQQNLNHSQCSVREMARLQDDDLFRDCVPIHFAILDYVDVLSGLFDELKQVSKDVLGKPGKDDRDWYKEECKKRKDLQKMEKDKIKKEADAQKEALKQLKQLDIIKE